MGVAETLHNDNGFRDALREVARAGADRVVRESSPPAEAFASEDSTRLVAQAAEKALTDTALPAKVFVVNANDRHVDPWSEVFTTADAAVGRAWEIARTGAGKYVDEIEEVQAVPSPFSPDPGWLIHLRWSPEGDSVWVVEQTVQGAG